jgi:hypothetical protein
MASIPLWGGGLAALGVVLLVGYGTWRYLAPARGDALGINVRPRPLAALLGLNILLYAVFVLASVSAFDALTPLNDRILSPVYTQGILLALTLATVYWPRWGTAGRVLAGAACVAFVFFQGYRVAFAAQGLRSDGQGYAGQQWRDSHVLDYACNLPDVPLYSNDLPALYFACGRIATALPSLVNLSTGLPNPGFETEVEAVVDRARLSGALVIFVGWSGEERMQRTGFSELARRLTLLRSFDDGRVYVSP